ncbi:serine hydrolase domain-containing protein [Streptomyces buecherae]|uniref:serine hydrolase domain-containing protein n=1 Tax=Streptomyces buecherae TaxID=2763006 RepID=UPI001C25C140|nr:serine hydrolase domain-containing protein [Streptomyces buecherae]
MTNVVSLGHEKVQRVLDRAVAEMHIPGIVAEVKGPDGVWLGTAGLADITTGRRRRTGEYVHVGSAGKAFTSATMLQLEAEGKLDIDDPVEKWLPGLLGDKGYDGERITIRHLLNNTSGLFITGLAPEISRRYSTRSGFLANRFDTWTTDELLRLALSQPPVHEPGAGFSYSNGGYYLAGAIIEKATGNSYAQEVDRTVIRPLGLSHTYVRPADDTGYPNPHPRAYSEVFLREGVDPADVTAENWRSMFESPGLGPLDTTDFNSSWAWAAGNVVSTTSEMVRALEALASGTLLPPEQHRKMWTTVSTEGGNWMPHARYGLGVFELDEAVTDGLRLRGVGGSLQGSHIAVVGTPDGEHTIAFHTNTEYRTWALIFELVAAEFGIPAIEIP